MIFLAMLPEGSQHLLSVAGSRNLAWLLMAGHAFTLRVKGGKERKCLSGADAVLAWPLLCTYPWSLGR